MSNRHGRNDESRSFKVLGGDGRFVPVKARIDDEIVLAAAAIAASPFLGQLEPLELSSICITEAGAQILTSGRKMFQGFGLSTNLSPMNLEPE